MAAGLLVACGGSQQFSDSYFNGRVSVQLYVPDNETGAQPYLDFMFYQSGTYHVYFEGGSGTFHNFTQTVTSPRNIVINREEFPENFTVTITNGAQTESHEFGPHESW